jgi:hypothetical protein
MKALTLYDPWVMLAGTLIGGFLGGFLGAGGAQLIWEWICDVLHDWKLRLRYGPKRKPAEYRPPGTENWLDWP